METVKKNIPKLRFPEFSSEWDGKKIKDVSKISSGGTPSRTNPKYWNGNIPWITTSEIDFNIVNQSNEYITEDGLNNSSTKIFPKRTILMAMYGQGKTRGKVAILNIDATTNQACAAIIPNSKIDYAFLFQALSKDYDKIRKLSNEGGQKNLSGELIKNIRISIPTLPEQQKIASFLTAVDSKIEQLTEKKSLLEQYKKGVMQQIFTQQLRFKDETGKNYPDWEEKKFNDIFSFYPTNSFTRDKLNYENKNVMNIHYGDIHTKYSTLFNIEKESVPYINQDVNIANISNDNYCKEGDIIIADASENYDDIGKSIEIINLNNKKVLAGLHTLLARPCKFNMALGFSGHLLRCWDVKKQIMNIAQGTKVLSLSSTRLGQIKLRIPCIEEQIKIATLLSTIDERIEQVNTQIENTKQFKKGLLQQLFC